MNVYTKLSDAQICELTDEKLGCDEGAHDVEDPEYPSLKVT